MYVLFHLFVEHLLSLNFYYFSLLLFCIGIGMNVTNQIPASCSLHVKATQRVVHKTPKLFWT